MKISRKGFLRLAGFSLLVVAGKRAIGALTGTGAGQAATQSKSGVATRWAMVVDPVKCLKKEGCTDCITACHKAHNVPVIHDALHEVKWIWKEPFESVFPSQESAYTKAALKDTPVMVFCVALLAILSLVAGPYVHYPGSFVESVVQQMAGLVK